ncbi:MAG: hypothetical protein HY860_02635 [Chlamydiales bacterium]|nr:hypothetical protein [Chlamydiales bacterium]
MFKLFKNRRFQVDILTALLLLIGCSSIFIISFTYSKMSKSILEFSKGTIQRASSSSVEKVNDLITNAQQLVTLASGFFADKDPITAQDPNLIQFLLNAASFPLVDAFYAADKDGNFIGVFDFSERSGTQHSFFSKKQLPANTLFGLAIQTPDGKEYWYYKDKDFNDIATEEFSIKSFDPRERPWYIGAQKTHGLYWSDIYRFFNFDEDGLTTSTTLLNKQGELQAIIGVDLSLDILSQFLAKEQIGVHGKVFILDQHGKVIIPTNHKPLTGVITQDVLDHVYQNYLTTHEGGFVLTINKEDFLASAAKVSLLTDKYWIVITTAPMLDFFSELLDSQQISYIISFIVLLIACLVAYFFSRRISIPITTLAHEVDKITQLDFSSNVRVKSNIKEIIIMDSSIYAMKVALQSFAKYVPKKVIEQLIQQGNTISLGGVKQNVTVFFSDIEDFTKISETISTELLMNLLAQYFDGMSKIILSNVGTIDKYIGDSIMAFWGAPTILQDHSKQACICALLCKQFIMNFNKEEERKHLPMFQTRIGIHTGDVIVGNIGTSERMNYTIIGDAVNTASRLQVANKTYHTTIIISEDVLLKANHQFLVRPLDAASIRGKQEKIKIYELLDRKDSPVFQDTYADHVILCDLFTEAYHIFENKDLGKAKKLFEEILTRFPEDLPTKIYLTRIAENMPS